MSSPHPNHENAAPPAPLRPAARSIPNPGPVDGHAETSPQEHHGRDDTTNAPFSSTAPVSAPSSVSVAPVDGITLPSRRGDPDPDDLKTRAIPKQPSRSLLTQALASARGIPPPTQDAPTTHHQDGLDQHKPPSKPPPSPASSRASPDKQLSSPWSSGHGSPRDGDIRPSLLPVASQPVVMAAPATISLAAREPSSVPSSYDQLVLAHARDFLFDHRDFLDRAKSRASTSLELDRSAPDSFHAHTFPHSSVLEGSLTSTKASSFGSFESTPILATQMTRDTPHKSGAPSTRPRPAEQALTHGPEKNEKVWSIGSGDGNEEDGLVEQSVAEAMAGVEPNARSRKASYSLRFFKEGLPPDEKGRRKDAKPSQRERLPPALEDGRAPNDVLADASTPRAIQTLSMSMSAAESAQSTRPFSLQTDYFDVRGTVPANRAASPTRAQLIKPAGLKDAETTLAPHGFDSIEFEGEASEPESASEARTRGHDNGSDAGGDAHVEADADDSGEEKISSAVFLPHQEMPEARMKPGDSVDLVRTSRLRSLSQSKAHPWLVKADEPELEPEIHDEVEPASLCSLTLRSRETLVSRKGDVLLEPSDECSVSDELEVKSPVPARLPQAVTRYEDHVHEHQHHGRKPLEAIELIPYKHQVGGHTTLWRFSRRAVCKQLNNRENEFYETIERYHRDLLPFLPRYVDHESPRSSLSPRCVFSSLAHPSPRAPGHANVAFQDTSACSM